VNPPWAAHPAADSCLKQPYSSRPNQKGGTIIAETVADLANHLCKLARPDEYRPKMCCHCGKDRLHVHALRERHPRQLVFEGEPVPVVSILVFICKACLATWRILPAFLARCLWRSWEVVEQETSAKPRATAVPPVPPRTVQRWRSRLAQTARLPVQVLAVAGGELRKIAERAGLDATREQLLQTYGRGFASLAVLLHRLAPGVRLM
jgi:hypothetical protein